MTIQPIDVEADTLEEARSLLAMRIPAGFSVISEKVISDGQPHAVEGFAPTLEEARAKAQAAVPSAATILGIEEVTSLERKPFRSTRSTSAAPDCRQLPSSDRQPPLQPPS